jgi:hypothetical protein
MLITLRRSEVALSLSCPMTPSVMGQDPEGSLLCGKPPYEFQFSSNRTYCQTTALDHQCFEPFDQPPMSSTWSTPGMAAEFLPEEASTDATSLVLPVGTCFYQSLSSRRFGFDMLLAEPCERPTRQINEFLCQAVYHDHEDIGADRGEDMPPTMKFQYETPRHPDGTLPRSQLGAVDKVQLPEEVAEDEASCVGVSLPLGIDCRHTGMDLPAPNIASLLRVLLSSDFSTRLLINALVRPMTSRMRNRKVSSCTTCSFI